MKIKTSEFCQLASTPSWQGWLYHFNIDLYKDFIAKLRESKGCGHNKDLMTELLAKIDRIPDGNDKLLQFLGTHYRHILIEDTVFPNYVPGILTYPRRLIMTDENPLLLSRKVKAFLLDKLKYDTLTIGNTAYIEYLLITDDNVVNDIPMDSWKIAAWRLQNQR